MSEAPAAPRPLWRRVTGSVWFHLFASLVVLSLVLSFVAKPYRVPSGSMQETLQPGDLILINRLAYLGAGVDDGPATGDVIVFDADETWGEYPAPSSNPVRRVLREVAVVTGFGPTGWHTLVKRVVAGPGDRVGSSPDGRMLVNGDPLDEPYVTNDLPFEAGSLDCATTPRSPRCLPEVTVPDDAYLVLGDNRSGSSDSAAECRTEGATSACYRWVRRDQVVGHVVATLWPPGSWSGTP